MTLKQPFPRLFGNRIIVQHNGSNVRSNIIIIPDEHRKRIAGIEATVLQVGEKFVGRSDVMVGDVVVVPEHFGDRGLVKSNDKAIVYSGEDVLAVVGK